MTNPIEIFDKKAANIKAEKALKTFGQADFLYNEVATRLIEQFGTNLQKKFSNILEIGAKNNLIYNFFDEAMSGSKYSSASFYNGFLKQQNCTNKTLLESEILPFKYSSFDLILANLSLHTINDLVGFLVQIKNSLSKSGLFIATSFGIQTLKELRIALIEAEMELTGAGAARIMPFIDAQSGAALLQRTQFNEPTSSSEIIQVKYENIFDLMHDLKNMGETNILQKRQKNCPPKKLFALANEKFLEANPEGLVTFEIITLSGWKL